MLWLSEIVGRDAAADLDVKKALDLDYQKSAAKLQAQDKEYKEFCKNNGLKTRAERISIAKWDREQAAAARGAAKKYESQKKKAVPTVPKIKPDTEAVEIPIGQSDIYGLYQPTSEYITEGRFDIEKANADYEKFLTTVPESCRMELETAYRTAEIVEDKVYRLPFFYDSKTDRVVYNSSHPKFKEYSYPQALTHELAHRIDTVGYSSEKSRRFHKAIEDAYEIAVRYADRLHTYSFDEDEDGFISDIISAISKSEIKTYASHKVDYWAKSGRKEREIFANLFSIEAFDQTKHKELLSKMFPDLVKAYRSLRKGE